MNGYIISILTIAIINIGYAYALEYDSYKGILYGFRIDYPKDWIVRESEYTFSYIKVTFTSNSTNDYNPFMLIGIETLQDTTFEEYATLLIKQQERYLNNFTLIQIYDSIITGNKAKSIEFTGIDNNIHINGIIAYTMIDNTAYTMIASSKYNEFAENKVIFEYMINSFRIDKSIMPKPAPPIYEDSSMKIRFPEGWHGLIVNVDNTTNIRLKPSIRSDTLLNVIISDINSIDIFKNTLLKILNKEVCSIINLNFININSAKGLEISQKCNESISKTYLFAISNKVLAIELISRSKEFNTYSNNIEEMVKSIEGTTWNDISIYIDDRLKDIPERVDSLDIIQNLEGWNIFKRVADGSELIYITKNGSNIISNYSSFIITPRLDIDKILTINQIDNDKCNIISIYYIAEEDNILEEEATCDNNIKLRVFKLDDYTIGYIIKDNINANFTQLLNKFIDADLGRVVTLKDELEESSYSLLVNGTEMMLKYSYMDTAIKSITLHNLRLVMNLSTSENNQGLLEIDNSLLEGPYIVSINNKIITTPDVDKLVFSYKNDNIITIDGRRVIPETYLPLLLITLSMIVIIIKYRAFKYNR